MSHDKIIHIWFIVAYLCSTISTCYHFLVTQKVNSLPSTVLLGVRPTGAFETRLLEINEQLTFTYQPI